MRKTVRGGEKAEKTERRASTRCADDASAPSRAVATGATASGPAGEGTTSAKAGASSQQPLAAALTPGGGAQHACSSACPDAARSGAQPHGAGRAATRARPASTAASVGDVRLIGSS